MEQNMQSQGKFLLASSVWTGSISGLFVMVYLFTPLASYNIIWMAFISVPIFLNAGATKKDFMAYSVSGLLGIGWAVLYLFITGKNMVAGLSMPLANTLTVILCTTLLCILHLIVLPRTWLNNIPIIFGAIASVFSQGGENLIPTFITYFYGIILAMTIAEGNGVLKKIFRNDTGGAMVTESESLAARP